jgi:hypothetical protein
VADEKGQADLFKCQVCGADCPVAPDPPARAVCEAHCEQVHGSHDYRHDKDRRGKYCVECDKPQDVDYGDDYWD